MTGVTTKSYYEKLSVQIWHPKYDGVGFSVFRKYWHQNLLT